MSYLTYMFSLTYGGEYKITIKYTHRTMAKPWIKETLIVWCYSQDTEEEKLNWDFRRDSTTLMAQLLLKDGH